jgi:hypothetical protein
MTTHISSKFLKDTNCGLSMMSHWKTVWKDPVGSFLGLHNRIFGLEVGSWFVVASHDSAPMPLRSRFANPSLSSLWGVSQGKRCLEKNIRNCKDSLQGIIPFDIIVSPSF